MAKTEKRSVYRPHPRVQEFGEITDPITGEVTQPPSMTKQEFIRECDINNIIKAYSTTGVLNHISANAAAGAYQDLPEAIDFQESMHLIQAAEASFMSLPAKVRDRFQNEPANFLDFMSNPDNLPEMRALGLANPLPDPVPETPKTASTGELKLDD